MNDTTQTLLRSLLKIFGGFFVAKGFADDNTAQAIIAGIIALIGVAWGILHRTPDRAQPVNINKVGLVFVLVSALALTPGCQSTTASDVAYKTEGTIVTTADTAMKAWADWVKAGNATQDQVNQVKAAYEKYCAAQHLAKTAVDEYLAAKTPNNSNAVMTATQDVSESIAGVLEIIQPLIQKQKVP